MSWVAQRSDIRWVCAYLTTVDAAATTALRNAFPVPADPHRVRPDRITAEMVELRGWTAAGDGLRELGWGLAPTVLGLQALNAQTAQVQDQAIMDAQAGRRHARMAKWLASHAHGIAPGSLILIDDEPGERVLTAGERAYFVAFFEELAHRTPGAQDPLDLLAYRPGFYGHNHTAIQLVADRPDLIVWHDDLVTATSFSNVAPWRAQPPRIWMQFPQTTIPVIAPMNPAWRSFGRADRRFPAAVWPMARQAMWLNANVALPDFDLARQNPPDPAAHGVRPTSPWDYSLSLVPDPTSPVASPRIGASAGQNVAALFTIRADDPQWPDPQRPPDTPKRGFLTSYRITPAGDLRAPEAQSDGRMLRGRPWSGAFIHPLSPVRGDLTGTIFPGAYGAVVLTSRRLGLVNYAGPPDVLALDPRDRQNQFQPCVDAWAARLPYALAYARLDAQTSAVAWVGQDHHVWIALPPISQPVAPNPHQLRAEDVHPFSQLAAVRRGMGLDFAFFDNGGQLLHARWRTGEGFPCATLNVVSAAGTLLPAASVALCAPAPDALVLTAIDADLRVRVATYSDRTRRWTAAATITNDANDRVSPHAGLDLMPVAAGAVFLGAVALSTRGRIWRLDAANNWQAQAPQDIGDDHGADPNAGQTRANPFGDVVLTNGPGAPRLFAAGAMTPPQAIGGIAGAGWNRVRIS